METQRTKNPSWWTDSHNQGWDRVKEAFRRDWEQTKSDFSKTKGRDLHQEVGDTVKQAVGKEPIPPTNRPNASSSDDDFSRHEPAYRYGYGARDQYGLNADAQEWNQDIEAKLEDEWADLDYEEPWDSARLHVRRGWEHPHRS